MKALYFIKFKVGFIKKHTCPEQPRQIETHGQKKFVLKSADFNKRTRNFIVARKSTTFTEQSLVNRPLTNINDNDSGQIASMTMTVVL